MADPEPVAAKSGAARIPLRGWPRRWVVILAVAVALLTGTVLAARGGHSGGGSAGLTGTNPSTGSGSGGEPGNVGGHGGPGSGPQGGPGGAAVTSPGGAGHANSSSAPGSQASPRPTATPYQTLPPNDSIAALADIKTSTCPGGYPPNYTCKVYVHGRYNLFTKPAGQVIVEVLVDGKVAYSQTYQAPHGGYQFGSLMQFQVPQGSKEVDYEALLEDVTGNLLAHSVPVVTYA